MGLRAYHILWHTPGRRPGFERRMRVPEHVCFGLRRYDGRAEQSSISGGAACGACFQIKCVHIRETKTAKNWCWSYSRSITVTATNLCPPGSTDGWCNPPRHHFDLPYPAYLTLAKREGGVALVYYRRVPCRKRGGIRFTIGGNPCFFMILIHNVGGSGDVKSVKINCPGFGWVPMYRNWGSLWTVRRQMQGQLSFMITTFDGRTVVALNAVGRWWHFGQTWECGAQFR